MNSRRLMSFASSTASDKPCRTNAQPAHIANISYEVLDAEFGWVSQFVLTILYVPFLVANALTDTIIIALDRADGNGDRALKTFELAGPTSQFAIVSPSCNWD
jgi:hypothetical protein